MSSLNWSRKNHYLKMSLPTFQSRKNHFLKILSLNVFPNISSRKKSFFMFKKCLPKNKSRKIIFFNSYELLIYLHQLLGLNKLCSKI